MMSNLFNESFEIILVSLFHTLIPLLRTEYVGLFCKMYFDE